MSTTWMWRGAVGWAILDQRSPPGEAIVRRPSYATATLVPAETFFADWYARFRGLFRKKRLVIAPQFGTLR